MTKQITERVKSYIRGFNPRQLWAVFRLELGRNLFSRRILIPLLLASIPVILMGIWSFFDVPEEVAASLGGSSAVYATVFRAFILRLLLFFSCVAVFTRLVRGDLQEQVMHYYLLCPVRRDILLTGKYLAGVAAVGLCFMASVTASYLMFFQAGGANNLQQFVLMGVGKFHLGAYLGITLLACFGYGAVFLLFGMLFKNPIIPASGAGTGVHKLPAAGGNEKFSVIFYLESLCPVPIKESVLSVAADPASWPVAILSLGLLSFVFLAISTWKFKKLQII